MFKNLISNLLILLFFAVSFVLCVQRKSLPQKITETKKLPECVTEEKIVTVRGNSLSGLIEPNDTVKILVGYYKCMPAERGDIVAYNYAGNDVPIIKVVKGLENDRFQLKKSEPCWQILINDDIVKNAQNIPYCFDETGYRMLSLYERDYKGIIPKDTYLILGNMPQGTLDSTRFGLIHQNDILGKISTK